ncbi:MAG: AMP-binding protein [Desulfosalsimonas sp.]
MKSSENNLLRIGDIVEQNARKFKDRVALAYHEYGLENTFPEFRDICRQTAKGLMALGVKRGDHIAVWANNLPQWVYLQFGSAMAGAVMVTVNTNFRAYELEYLLNQSDATTLIMTKGIREPDEYLRIVRQVCPEVDNCLPGGLETENCLFSKTSSISEMMILPECITGTIFLSWAKTSRAQNWMKELKAWIRTM